MAQAATNPVYPPIAIPVLDSLPSLLFAVLLLLMVYFVGIEEGTTSIIPGMYVHEFVHDGVTCLASPVLA